MNARGVGRRAFPVIYTDQVSALAAFYELLGFVRHIQHPPAGPVRFVALRRDAAEVGVAATDGTARRAGSGPVEMFVFVDAVDELVDELRARGVPVLREPADTPWGERVAQVGDPDGNPVALAAPA
ncbi:VOC family protein [Solwaraspora sp. WMMD791]|uniref:VOC family protein n=1 Tax=Solwaraspora sp. WMMD791 TaxID=3016086 RepID=UPI00249AEFF8|nr:VOC family protein [Solwaraspora sp. WMMD791]WFE26123.1 VOC family protein [Solwaraspora sp. WMMD791]